MSKTWIVFANASRARICARDTAQGELHDLMDFVHTQSRQKSEELEHDQPGRVERGMARDLHGGTALDPRSDPHEKEHERFAREIAQQLDKGVAAHECDRVVLVASNPFLGRIKSQLGAATARAVWATVPSDYTALNPREAARRLDEVLPR